MCKEDIRLARAAAPKSSVTQTPPLATQLLFPADGNRYSLSSFALCALTLTKQINGVIAAKSGGNYYPLITISVDHPGGTVSLTDVGAIIFEEIWFVSGGNDLPDSLVSGYTAFNQTLESV